MHSGLYVDNTHTLRVIVQKSKDAKGMHELNVFCASRDAPDEACAKEGWVEKAIYNEHERTVTLMGYADDAPTATGRIMGDDEHCRIVWDDDVWHPLHMSYLQRRVLNYRTYVPMTYLIFFLLGGLLRTLRRYATCAAARIRGTKAAHRAS
jgi:hypothetical protein